VKSLLQKIKIKDNQENETNVQELNSEDSVSSSVQAVQQSQIKIQEKTKRRSAAQKADISNPVVEIENLTLKYSDTPALADISLDIPKNQVTAFIGPSGCGKSTLIRCLNRLNDLVDGVTIEGTIKIDGINIYDPKIEITELRKRVGMVFQKSNPFPKSIYDNVAYGPQIAGIKKTFRSGRNSREEPAWRRTLGRSERQAE
jgi:ABC-type phosphate transport system, ATPase component